MALPHVLASVFVCVTFHWQTSKLVYLEEVLASFASYKTYTEVAVVTDYLEQLEAAIQDWQTLPAQMQVVQATDDTTDEHEYKLLWAHRSVVQEAFQKDRFTAYLYVEDDQIISWPAMVSWCWDIQALQPGGWQRGFFRTEVSPDHGHEVMLDIISKIDVSNYPRVVSLNTSAMPGMQPCSLLYHNVTGKATRRWCHDHGKCECYHEHYIQMIEPFQGFWVATHELLRRFIASPWWEKQSALQQPIGGIWNVGGYPERSTWGIQLFELPSGFDSAIVVPYDPLSMQLELVAKVRHLRNGYSARTDFEKLVISDVLV